ncbi:MAG: LLM class flavin-dependent oxidoreductase [Candidatus Saccharimonadaceae bacterium]
MTNKKSNKDTTEYLFGIDTFGDLPTSDSGELFTHAAAIRQVVEEGVLADKLGIDIIGVGEHHRSDFSISSPETVLAGIATRTSRIKLASAVTVLSSDDPVRVYERFATVDALSNGRAQVILGRGSFTESFPLFGYDLRDYEILFEEKVGLFAELLNEKPVSWKGTKRAELKEADVFPKTEKGRLDVAIGVGGSPESVIRAARYNFPLVLAIIGGAPDRFAPYVELYRQAAADMGNEPHPVGMHSPGLVADTDEAARKLAWPNFKKSWDRIGRTRGWPPYTREQFDYEIEHGSLYVGSPETVALKIAHAMKVLDVTRFDMVYGQGPQKASARLKSIELYATKVIPRVRELLKENNDK